MELVFPKEEKFYVRKFQLELLEEGLPTLKLVLVNGIFSSTFKTIKHKSNTWVEEHEREAEKHLGSLV
jgi:hypothetical protein